MVFSLAVTASRWVGFTHLRWMQSGPPGHPKSSVWHLWSIWYPSGIGPTFIRYEYRWAMTLGWPGEGWNFPYPSRVPCVPVHSQHPFAWGFTCRWKRASSALLGVTAESYLLTYWIGCDSIGIPTRRGKNGRQRNRNGPSRSTSTNRMGSTREENHGHLRTTHQQVTPC